MAHTSATTRRSRRPSSPFSRGISLGRWFGFDVRLDYSVLIIAALVVMSLSTGALPAWHPDWSAALTFAIAVAAALLFFASILVHELSHAIVGRWLGVPISGITLFLFGGMAHMEQEPERPKAEFLMAAVGPLTSIAIGVLSLIGGSFLARDALMGATEDLSAMRLASPGATLLLWLGPVNIVLGVFNLVPGFPLDGGRVLRATIWWLTGSYQKATHWATLGGQAFAWLLIASGVLMMFGWHIPFLGRGLGQGLWLVLIGWFLSNAAKASQYQALVQGALQGVRVRQLMQKDVEVIGPETSVFDLVHERILREEQRCYPVVSGATFLGMVSLDDVRRVPESEWLHTPVASVMASSDQVASLRPDDAAADALRLFGRLDAEDLPVMEEQRLVGMLRRQSLLRWLTLKLEGDGQSRTRRQLPGFRP